MHGAWEQTTGHHTQLFPSDLDPQGTKCFNVVSRIRKVTSQTLRK